MNARIAAYFADPKIRAAGFRLDSSLYDLKFRADSGYADSISGLWRRLGLDPKGRQPVYEVVARAYREKSLQDADQGFLLNTFHAYYRECDSILYDGGPERFSTWVFNGTVIKEKDYRGDSILSVVWNRRP